MIHTTIGVYANPARYMWKVNGVSSEHLDAHINYNKKYRPGRALFVDGECVYSGSLSEAAIADVKVQLQAEPIQVRFDTAPYH